jgi:hypothetical protein
MVRHQCNILYLQSLKSFPTFGVNVDVAIHKTILECSAAHRILISDLFLFNRGKVCSQIDNDANMRTLPYRSSSYCILIQRTVQNIRKASRKQIYELVLRHSAVQRGQVDHCMKNFRQELRTGYVIVHFLEILKSMMKFVTHFMDSITVLTRTLVHIFSKQICISCFALNTKAVLHARP